MASEGDPYQRRALGWALVLYLLWTAATYLLEGRILTLLRPEAVGDRLIYAVVANLLIGLGGALWMLRQLCRMRVLTLYMIGFRGWKHAVGSALAGGALGLGLYAFQNDPVWHPMVLTNAFAQVWVVSTAEVLVCWAVAGSVAVAVLYRYGTRVAYTGAALLASVLFGAYHFAHSPPFNALDMALLLTAVGLGTSVFYFVSGDLYGTLVFHNLLGTYGVTQSLQAGGRLAAFEQPQLPLLAMAVVTLGLLIAAEVFWLRERQLSSAPS